MTDYPRLIQAVQDAQRTGEDVFEIETPDAAAAHRLMMQLAQHGERMDFEVTGTAAHLVRLGLPTDATTFDGWPLYRGTTERIDHLRIKVRPKQIGKRVD